MIWICILLLPDDLHDARNHITEITRRLHELELELRRLENERDELTAAYKEAEAVSSSTLSSDIFWLNNHFPGPQSWGTTCSTSCIWLCTIPSWSWETSSGEGRWNWSYSVSRLFLIYVCKTTRMEYRVQESDIKTPAKMFDSFKS